MSLLNRRSLEFPLTLDNMRFVVMIEFASAVDSSFYSLYTQQLQDKSILGKKESESLARANFLRFSQLIITLFFKQDFKDILRIAFEDKAITEAYLTKLNNTRVRVELDLIPSKLGSLTSGTNPGEDTTITLRTMLLLEQYVAYKSTSKFNVQSILKILSHELLHDLDKDQLEKIRAQVYDLQKSHSLEYLAINRVVAAIRREGLALVLESRNSSRIRVQPLVIVELLEVWNDLLENPARFDPIYNYRLNCFYRVGVYYCLLDLIYLSNAQNQSKLVVANGKFPLSNLNNFLKRCAETSEEFFIEAPPRIYNFFPILQKLDLFEFIKLSIEVVNGFGVEKGFNPLSYLPEIENACKLKK